MAKGAPCLLRLKPNCAILLAARCRELETETTVEDQKKLFADLARNYEELADTARARKEVWERPISKRA